MARTKIIAAAAMACLTLVSCGDAERKTAIEPEASAPQDVAELRSDAAPAPTAEATEPAEQPATAAETRCEIYGAEGEVLFADFCDFRAESGGSFSISPIEQGRFYGDILSVTMSIIEPGVAEVRGLTADGINSRWGRATRDPADGACWQGSDFRICAR